MTTSILERLGYRVTSVTDSAAAMRLFSASSQAFDLIITDQTMSEMTGIEFARKALGVRKDMPILVCTGYSETVSLETAKEAGIREFVMKPITRKQMTEAIRRAMNKGETAG